MLTWDSINILKYENNVPSYNILRFFLFTSSISILVFTFCQVSLILAQYHIYPYCLSMSWEKDWLQGENKGPIHTWKKHSTVRPLSHGKSKQMLHHQESIKGQGHWQPLTRLQYNKWQLNDSYRRLLSIIVKDRFNKHNRTFTCYVFTMPTEGFKLLHGPYIIKLQHCKQQVRSQQVEHENKTKNCLL